MTTWQGLLKVTNQHNKFHLTFPSRNYIAVFDVVPIWKTYTTIKRVCDITLQAPVKDNFFFI